MSNIIIIIIFAVLPFAEQAGGDLENSTRPDSEEVWQGMSQSAHASLHRQTAKWCKRCPSTAHHTHKLSNNIMQLAQSHFLFVLVVLSYARVLPSRRMRYQLATIGIFSSQPIKRNSRVFMHPHPSSSVADLSCQQTPVLRTQSSPFPSHSLSRPPFPPSAKARIWNSTLARRLIDPVVQLSPYIIWI
jgi:hypothetical protein